MYVGYDKNPASKERSFEWGTQMWCQCLSSFARAIHIKCVPTKWETVYILYIEREIHRPAVDFGYTRRCVTVRATLSPLLSLSGRGRKKPRPIHWKRLEYHISFPLLMGSGPCNNKRPPKKPSSSTHTWPIQTHIVGHFLYIFLLQTFGIGRTYRCWRIESIAKTFLVASFSDDERLQ